MKKVFKCSILGREFDSRDEMFKALKANKKDILALKRSTVKHSEGLRLDYDNLKIKQHDGAEATKGNPADINAEGGYIYPVINTANFMDSHKDVHFDGIWDKSASEQDGKIYYAINHKLEIGSIVAFPQDVKVFVEKMSWKDLGQPYEGKTDALIYQVKLKEYANKEAVDMIKGRLPVENSVRMQYVKVEMGINSGDPMYAEEKAYYDKHVSKIVNKEQVEEDGYFFGVSEAKIVKEGSMVLEGSNSATPILHPKSEPEKSTHDSAQSDGEVADKITAEDYLREFYSNINI